MSAPHILMTMFELPLPRAAYKQYVEELRAKNRTFPDHLVPIDDKPPALLKLQPIALMRSRRFICSVFDEGKGAIRLTINRSEVELVNGNVCVYKAGITWDELQQLKREAGYGDRYAVEIFPSDEDLVNVANMRHLWVLPEPPPFAWRETPKPESEVQP